jgi:hypothetical protein
MLLLESAVLEQQRLCELGRAALEGLLEEVAGTLDLCAALFAARQLAPTR